MTKTKSSTRSPEGGMLLVTPKLRAELPPLDFVIDEDTAIAIARFFATAGRATWYAVNGGPGGHFGFKDDIVMCGLVTLDGETYECGPFSQRELETLRLPLGLRVERDVHFRPTPLREIAKRLQRA